MKRRTSLSVTYYNSEFKKKKKHKLLCHVNYAFKKTTHFQPRPREDFFSFCLKDRQLHTLKLIITILLYTSLGHVTSLLDLPGLRGIETDQGLKVTAVTSPASIRKINLPRDASMERSESQGWILLLVTRSKQNCTKVRKSKSGPVSTKPPAVGLDGSKTIGKSALWDISAEYLCPV